jgi:hypothetical protein
MPSDLKRYINGADIPISASEIARLREHDMLTDNNVNRILRDLFVHFDRLNALSAASDVFVLNSTFLDTLTTGGTALRDARGQRVDRFSMIIPRAQEIASTWNLNILRKRYICIVVCLARAQWMLYIVVTPFASAECKDPLFLVLDSCNHTLRGTQTFHSANLRTLCAFFGEYARERGADAGIKFDGWHRGYKMARVPAETPGSLYSGMHTCLYVSRFCSAGEAARAEMIRRAIDDEADAAENTLFHDITPELVDKAYDEIARTN